MIEAVGLVLGAPPEESAPAPKVDVRKEITNAARRKAVAAASAQPPNMSKAGLDNTGGNVDPRTMTYDKFVKLPEDELARLRGDLI
jgi:hypothetical protein